MAGIEHWVPTPAEQSYYDLLLSVAAGGVGGELAGKAAVDFFTRSGLEKPVLKAVRRLVVHGVPSAYPPLQTRPLAPAPCFRSGRLRTSVAHRV
jgi:hypothetical protein